jgi:hypothetical protein
VTLEISSQARSVTPFANYGDLGTRTGGILFVVELVMLNTSKEILTTLVAMFLQVVL